MFKFFFWFKWELLIRGILNVKKFQNPQTIKKSTVGNYNTNYIYDLKEFPQHTTTQEN